MVHDATSTSREIIMCEINPKHTLIFRLEVYTSNPTMTKEEFLQLVAERLIQAEQDLNKDGKIRVHIHSWFDRRAKK